RSRRQSGKIAFCGLMVALSVALMLAGGIIPIATYCAPMAAAILLLPILLEYGRKTAWTAYAAVSLIVLMLGFDKEAAFFYVFLGYYPILKWDIDRMKNKRLHLPCKLLVFNGAIVLMYVMLGLLMNMTAIIEEFTQMGTVLLIVFMLTLNVCLLLYDRLLFPMVYLYANKIKPRLKFIH
ncbi:MAG: hypothetical protein ACI4WX_00570, partial [Aristaeellaceae bacterium]